MSLVDKYRQWAKSHKKEDYGRFDAFKAGYQLAVHRCTRCSKELKSEGNRFCSVKCKDTFWNEAKKKWNAYLKKTDSSQN